MRSAARDEILVHDLALLDAVPRVRGVSYRTQAESRVTVAPQIRVTHFQIVVI